MFVLCRLCVEAPLPYSLGREVCDLCVGGDEGEPPLFCFHCEEHDYGCAQPVRTFEEGPSHFCPECFSPDHLYAVRRQRRGESHVGCVNCGHRWPGRIEEKDDYIEGLKAAPFIVRE